MNARQIIEGEAKRWLKSVSKPYADAQVRQEFIDYLEHTLIPDLIESGREATAEEFELGVQLLKAGPTRDPFNEHGVREWVRWMQDTWVPDLRQDGYDGTADDADTLIRFLHAQGHPAVFPVSGSYDKYPHRRKDDEVEESAKDWIMRQKKPLRLGKDWTLYIWKHNAGKYDKIPVELIHEPQGYFPNTLDAPYVLGQDVDAVLLYNGGRHGGHYDQYRHDAIMHHYWDQIYDSVAKGVLRGTIEGAAGPREWELTDDYEQPF